MKLAKLWGMKGNSRKGWGRDPIPGSAGAPFRFQHLIPPAPQVTGRSAYKAYVSSYSIPLFPSTNGHKWELQGSYRRMGVTGGWELQAHRGVTGEWELPGHCGEIQLYKPASRRDDGAGNIIVASGAPAVAAVADRRTAV
jgi:hypothetical protein